MAEITYSGRGHRGASPGSPAQAQLQPQPQHQATRNQRPSTASPRLESNNSGGGGRAEAARGAEPLSAQRMLAFLDSAERVTAKQQPQPMFPTSVAAPPPPSPSPGGGKRPSSGAQQRPQSAAPLHTSSGPRIIGAPPPPLSSTQPNKQQHQQKGGAKGAAKSRQYGRISMYDHSTADRAPHEVPGPVILRDLEPPRMGFPARPPEDYLRAGAGLSLRRRVALREQLRRHPANIEAPFQPGSGGVRLQTPPPGRHPASPRPLDWSAPSPSRPPSSLLRTYYDNGTLDFVAVRWRGSRADALVWARGVTRGPEQGGPNTRSYVAWAPEPPAELDLPTWLPIFIDGVREYDEPYRFLAVRGSEELLMKAGDTLHSFAGALVPPFKALLSTREPTCVAVGLQLMRTALAGDSRLAAAWAPQYWQFAQVLNLFRSRGGPLVVDLGYNSRAVASCRRLATDFITAFELAGGPAAAAAVRRYSPGADPAVTDASQERAAAKAAARAAEAGRQPGGFEPFTLF